MKAYFACAVLLLCVGCRSAGFDAGYMAYRNSALENKKLKAWSYSDGYKDGWIQAQKEVGYKAAK